MDGTPNKRGTYSSLNLEVKTRQKHTNMRFFLTDLGPQRMILGYPWFTAVQPKIDWAKGWINYAQLPVVIKTSNARQTQFTRAVKVGRQRVKLQVAMQTKAFQLAEQNQNKKAPQLLSKYRRHAKVFNKQQAQCFPESCPWDHAIELKKDTPSTLPGKIYSLTQSKQKVLQKFIKEHLQKGYIRPSKSPYAAPFFFIKKKDGKLRPVQDYRRINEWTIKTVTCYLSSQSSSTRSRAQHCSQSSMLGGATTTSESKRGTSGRLRSLPTRACLSQESCSSDSRTPQQPFKP